MLRSSTKVQGIQSLTPCATPGFINGFARGLDLFGMFNCYSTFDRDGSADHDAITQDWRILGENMRSALRDSTSE